MAKRKHQDAVVISLEVLPKCPRLAYRGMDAPFIRPSPVPSHIVEIVDPSHMTVFEGEHLDYAHAAKDGGIPCDGSGEQLLAPKPDGGHQYTKRAIELLSKERRRHLRALK